MITIKDATKIYEVGNDKVRALDNVNMEIDDREFLAVMGPSGSGKSTLLYALGGLLTPTNGTVTVDGVSVYELTSRGRAEFVRENVGFIFQGFELLPYLTAFENVMLPLYLSDRPPIEQKEAAREALKKVGLTKRAFHKPTELSGGEQQRVAIARGIVNNPSILLADEPTGNLDQKTGSEIMQLLCGLYRENDLTLILVTHDLANAGLAGKMVRMVDGHIVNVSNAKEMEVK
jgi:putative ABC transport system ATP-binding protein